MLPISTTPAFASACQACSRASCCSRVACDCCLSRKAPRASRLSPSRSLPAVQRFRLDRIIAPGSCGGSGESYFPNILGLRSVPRRSRARRGSATRRGSAVRSARLSPLRSTRLGSARRGSAPLHSPRRGAALLRSARDSATPRPRPRLRRRFWWQERRRWQRGAKMALLAREQYASVHSGHV